MNALPIRLFLLLGGLYPLVMARAASTSTAAPPTAPTEQRLFTRYEQAEHANAWSAIRKYCEGCWSGAMSVNKVSMLGRLRLVEAPQRNFRLKVQTNNNKKTGSWTIWNLERTGDEFIVPLSPKPRWPNQLKMGFGSDEGGVILLIPNVISTALPRIVFEIGFWNAHDRRTAVLEYASMARWRRRVLMLGSWWRLNNVSLVQLKRVPRIGFVGNTTNLGDLAVLPTVSPFDWSDVPWSKLQQNGPPSERVELPSMKRTKLTTTQQETKNMKQRLVDTLTKPQKSYLFREVLPNGLCVVLPRHLKKKKNSSPHRCIFAHRWNERTVQAIEIEYEGTTMEAKSVTLHTFSMPKP